MRRNENVAASAADTLPAKLLQHIAPYLGDKPLLVDFWGLYCASCRMEMKTISDYSRKYPGKLDMLYVANRADTPAAKGNKFLKENKIVGNAIYLSDDDYRLLMSQLNFDAIPFTLIVNPDGTLQWRNPCETEIIQLLDGTGRRPAGQDR